SPAHSSCRTHVPSSASAEQPLPAHGRRGGHGAFLEPSGATGDNLSRNERRRERLEQAARQPVATPRQEEPRSFSSVVWEEDVEGQRRVNRMPRNQPISSDPILLTIPLCKLKREHAKPLRPLLIPRSQVRSLSGPSNVSPGHRE